MNTFRIQGTSLESRAILLNGSKAISHFTSTPCRAISTGACSAYLESVKVLGSWVQIHNAVGTREPRQPSDSERVKSNETSITFCAPVTYASKSLKVNCYFIFTYHHFQ